MKRLLLIFLLCIVNSILVACDDDNRSFTIDQVTIDATIQEDGTMDVQEIFTYTFDGAFNGVTRSIHSNEKNFTAYAIDHMDHSSVAVDTLEKLPTEFDDDEDMYKIFQSATNETKSVVYTYTVHNSVKKFADTGKLYYQFFDDSNETDIHHLTIRLSTEEKTHVENVHAFLREDGNGSVKIDGETVIYENKLLPANTNSYITYLFPPDAITQMGITKNKQVLADELAAQADWEKRGKQLPTKLVQLQPIVYLLIAIIVIITIVVLRIHPNRMRKYMDDESLYQFLEKTDPVFIHYLNSFLTIDHGAVIPALFSLKMRKVVRMEEVDSEKYPKQKTVRFTWLQTNSTVDTADTHLRDWLFTDKTNGKPSFLLDAVTDDADESEEMREEKGKIFDEQFETWKQLVEERTEYTHVRNRYPMYTWISVLFIAISAGVFYYLISIDQLTVKEQFWLQVVLGISTLIALLCARLKYITIFYYILIITLSIIFFTTASTTTASIVLFFLACIGSLVISAYFWTDEVGQIKHAMNKAYHEMFTHKYPIGTTTEVVENQLLYAITLNAGNKFAKHLDKEEFVQQLSEQSEFAFDPAQFAKMDAISDPTFYSAIALSSSSSSGGSTSSSSSSGGGGAGAF